MREARRVAAHLRQRARGRPGVYAAGDVRAGSTKRCATAVGEGAAVVGHIHERLASVAA